MLLHMKVLFSAPILIILFTVQTVAVPLDFSQGTAAPKSEMKLDGRWRVKFIISGVEKNLIFDTKPKGAGFFLLMDTAPGDKPVKEPRAAAWSLLTNDRVSFSGEAEMPIGTCCREIGTLIFKGNFISGNAISGRLIFVTSVSEEESPYGFHTVVGTFTANRVSAM